MNAEVRDCRNRGKILTRGTESFGCGLARSPAPRFHVRKHGGHFVELKRRLGMRAVLVFLEKGDRVGSPSASILSGAMK